MRVVAPVRSARRELDLLAIAPIGEVPLGELILEPVERDRAFQHPDRDERLDRIVPRLRRVLGEISENALFEVGRDRDPWPSRGLTAVLTSCPRFAAAGISAAYPTPSGEWRSAPV